MDDLSFLVQETFRVNELRQAGVREEDLEDGEEFWTPVAALPVEKRTAPAAPGIFFLLENQGGTFIVRTYPAGNLAESFALMSATPEDFPSLRLIQDEKNRLQQVDWFVCDSVESAEVIHTRIGHRRFPLREEDVCNLSDPGFSWWLEASPGQFSLHSKMGLLKEGLVRLGPLADAQIAPHRWNELAILFSSLPLDIHIGQEGSRFIMSADKDAWVVDEFCRVFLTGEISHELVDIFRLLGKRGVSAGQLETSWFFLHEISAVRQFWLQIEELL